MADSELIFKAMADATRQRLLRVLTVAELTVSELVEVLAQPQSTVSRHLKVLREAGLLVDRRVGATACYSLCSLSGTDYPESEGHEKKVNGSAAESAALRNRLLTWVGREAMDPATQVRLESVLRRRRADSRDFFESLGARWDQLRVEAFGNSFHWEALAALLPTGWVVADIGTGTGYLLPALAARFSKIIAVEPAGAMLDVARRRPELRSAPNVEFREGSLADLPIRSEEIDLAIASLVLHHVPQPETAIRELRRCLRRGGRLLLIEQAAHEHQGFHDRMGDYWWGFEPEAVLAWLSAAGFCDMRTGMLTSVQTSGRLAGQVPELFAITAGVPG